MIKGKLFSEIFDEFQKATTKQERIFVLKKYDHPSLRKFLFYIFSPDIEFDVAIPKYRPAPEPAGLNYTYLDLEVEKLYRFIKNDAKRPEGLTPEKQKQLLVVILESLHADEADLLVKVITNKFNVPYLTKGLITEAFK
jgi:hypothetical protein